MKARFATGFFATLLSVAMTVCSAEDKQATHKIDPQALPHIIVGGMAFFSGARKGFSVTKGQPTYHDWNAGAGNIAEPLQGAVAESFEAFDFPKNAAAVFARDSSHVYMARNYTPREIKGAHAPSFRLVTADGLYSRDKSKVYYLGVPIEDADPASFETLVFPFSQDKEHAYVGATPIPVEDNNSWIPLREGGTGDYWYRSTREVYPKERETVYVAGWSRDDGAFYYGDNVIKGIKVATFEVLSDYYARDKNHVYSRHYYDKLVVIKQADPTTFVVHEDADELLVRGADAHDANSQYRNGKVLKPK